LPSQFLVSHQAQQALLRISMVTKQDKLISNLAQ
jgi:hypothetical protein